MRNTKRCRRLYGLRRFFIGLCQGKEEDMKKKIVNALLSAAVFTAMLFSITACGSKSDDVQDAGANTASPAVTQQEAAEPAQSVVADNADAQETTTADAGESTTADEEELNGAAADGAMTLEDWTKSAECTQFSEMMNEGLNGMTISFEVDGDTISMIFTMTETIDVVEDSEDAMNEYFTSNAAIFEAIRDQLIEETGNQNTVLRLVYRNADGSDIFSMDF